MDEYNDECPVCGGQIYLIGAVISCRIPIHEDGWALDEGPADTEEETFECGVCFQGVPSGWVFGEILQHQATKIMKKNAAAKKALYKEEKSI